MEVRKEYLEFLNDYIGNNHITAECKNVLKYLIKKTKSMSDDSLMQFLEIHSIFYSEPPEEDNPGIIGAENYPEGYVLDEGGIYDFLDFLTGGGVAQVMPNGTTEFFEGSNPPRRQRRRASKNDDSPNNDGISWIKLEPMVISITNDSIKINESLWGYMLDTKTHIEFGPMKKFPMYPNDEIDDEDECTEIDIIIGEFEDKLAMTIVTGVTEFHKFRFMIDDGYAFLSSKDVEKFHRGTNNKFNGVYTFTLDRDKYSLIASPGIIYA